MMAAGEYFFVITIRFTAKQVGAARSVTITTSGTTLAAEGDTRSTLYKRIIDVGIRVFEQSFPGSPNPKDCSVLFYSLEPN